MLGFDGIRWYCFTSETTIKERVTTFNNDNYCNAYKWVDWMKCVWKNIIQEQRYISYIMFNIKHSITESDCRCYWKRYNNYDNPQISYKSIVFCCITRIEVFFKKCGSSNCVVQQRFIRDFVLIQIICAQKEYEVRFAVTNTKTFNAYFDISAFTDAFVRISSTSNKLLAIIIIVLIV